MTITCGSSGNQNIIERARSSAEPAAEVQAVTSIKGFPDAFFQDIFEECLLRCIWEQRNVGKFGIQTIAGCMPCSLLQTGGPSNGEGEAEAGVRPVHPFSGRHWVGSLLKSSRNMPSTPSAPMARSLTRCVLGNQNVIYVTGCRHAKFLYAHGLRGP